MVFHGSSFIISTVSPSTSLLWIRQHRGGGERITSNTSAGWYSTRHLYRGGSTPLFYPRYISTRHFIGFIYFIKQHWSELFNPHQKPEPFSSVMRFWVVVKTWVDILRSGFDLLWNTIYLIKVENVLVAFVK